MAMAPGVAQEASIDGGADVSGGASPVDSPNLRYFLMALFFIFGGITSLNDMIIPKLKVSTAVGFQAIVAE